MPVIFSLCWLSPAIVGYARARWHAKDGAVGSFLLQHLVQCRVQGSGAYLLRIGIPDQFIS